MRAFWGSYCHTVAFRSHEELERRGVQHLGVCLLARVDGTSPVDYLPEEPKREAVRALARTLLAAPAADWDAALAAVRDALTTIE